MAQACTIVCATASGTQAQASESNKRFQFSLNNLIFEPGEILDGVLNIWEKPSNMEEVCSLVAILEGQYFHGAGQLIDLEASGLATHLDERLTKGTKLIPKQRQTKVIQVKATIVGSGHAVTDIQPGEYKFQLKIPMECPPSFSCGENGGRLKYSVRCVATLLSGSHVLLRERRIYVKPNCVSSWNNQAELSQPMTIDKVMSEGGNIHLWLKTNQKCYSPGSKIEFSLKVKNCANKKIRCIKIHLIQLVNLKSSKSTEWNNLIGVNNGPPVDSNSTHVWSGSLEIPEILPPSVEQANQSDALFIAFNYKLQVTMPIGGFFGTTISEEFPIQIGNQFAAEFCSTLSSPSQTFEPLQMSVDELRLRGRSMSVVSITASLPDYRTALCLAVPPPAYSTLSINYEPSAPTEDAEEH